MDTFEGKVAVVTGGASGIGRGIAHALATLGAHVVVADIEEERAEAVATELRDVGVRSLAVRFDAIDEASVNELARRSFEEFGEVHVLCNNAGVFTRGSVFEVGPRDLEWMFAVNVMGLVYGLRAFVPTMLQQPVGSHVVNTVSVSGLHALRDEGAYSATKFAAMAISEHLRGQLTGSPVGVSTLCPGAVNTAITSSKRNRQPSFGGPDLATPAPGTSSTEGMDPFEVGRVVVQGIRDNRAYIFTDGRHEPDIQGRLSEIATNFPPPVYVPVP
jgi:NADP-dependent 3-hydroxy acid dehydrogenase YdfG